MVKFNRRFRRKRRSATKWKIATRKPTARNQKYQIASLNNKVNKIASITRQLTYVMTQKHDGNTTLPANGYRSIALNALSTWTEVFTDSQSAGNKYKGIRFSLDFHMEPNDCLKSFDTTVFICYPKTQKVVNDCQGATQPALMPVLDTDYTLNGGQAYLNKKRWNIVRVYRMCTLPIITMSDAANFTNRTRQNRKYLKIKNPLNYVNRAGTVWGTNKPDDWDIKHSQRLQMFIFTDSVSPAAARPSLYYSCLQTGYTS